MTCLSFRQAALFAVTPGVAVTAVRRTLHRNHVSCSVASGAEYWASESKNDSAPHGSDNSHWLTDLFVTNICLFIGPMRSQSARRRELT